MDKRIAVRDAAPGDLAALTQIKGAGSESIHQDRLHDAQAPGQFRYLVLEAGGVVIGYACLVFRRPAYWSDADEREYLPQIVDLRVAEPLRGQGYGSAFIRAIEATAAAAGAKQIYLRVEPLDNPRAYALYLRLGYQPIQAEPYPKTWSFTDLAGQEHQGADWVVDMIKRL